MMDNAAAEKLWGLIEAAGLDRDDFEFSVFNSGPDLSPKATAIKLTYTPNGLSAESSTGKTQIANLFLAVCQLVTILVDKDLIRD